MMKSSIKQTIKLEIQINQKVKFGKIAYKPEESISKVLYDLKKIKILPERINESEVKYYDKNNNEISKSSEFSTSFDIGSDINLIKISVPQSSIDIEETTSRADEYIRSNKQKRRQMKEMNETESFVKNLKPIFSMIHDQQYSNISSLIDNQEYIGIINEYSNEHKQISLTNKIYEQILEEASLGRQITLAKFNSLEQIEDRSRQKIEGLVKRYNFQLQSRRQDLRLIEAKIRAQKDEEIKEIYKKVDKSKLESTDRIEQFRRQMGKKDKQIKDNEERLYEIIRDNEDKIDILSENISKLEYQNTQLQNKYETIRFEYQKIKKERQEYKAQSVVTQKIKDSEHTSNYMKYFVNKDFILNQLAMNPHCSQQLLSALFSHIAQLKGFTLLYKYDKPSVTDRFHKLIDFKENILVIAKTNAGRIFGAYSNLPFDPYKRQHSPINIIANAKSFLFNVYKNQLNIFPIKPNYDSISYQSDFIVFGNQEICIDRFEAKVESLFPNYDSSYLHYEDPKDLRKYFLSDQVGDSRAELSHYQIYQIISS